MKWIKMLLFLVLSAVKGSAQPFNVQVRGTTPVSTFDNIDVYRLQVRVTTDAGREMGSDKGVWIKLCNQDEGFYLGKAIDNFQEGHTDLYDILSFNIKKIKDIQFIHLSQTGGNQDYWGLKQIELLVNGNANPIFSKRYAAPLQMNSNAAPGGNPFYTIATSSDLRNSEGWRLTDRNSNIKFAPSVLTGEYIKSMAEAGMGDYISRTNGLGWSSTHYNRAIEMKYVSPTAIQFKYVLEADVPGTNPVIWVKYNMNFECKDQRLLLTVSDASVEHDNGPFTGMLPGFLKTFTSFIGSGLRKIYGKAADDYNPINLFVNKLYSFLPTPTAPGVQTPVTDCNALTVLQDGSVQIKNLAITNPAPIKVTMSRN